MTRKAKLQAKLVNKASDNAWTFAEAEQVLLNAGFKLERVKGSHHAYRRNPSEVIILPRHGNTLNKVYVATIREFLK